jgi:hypothetical protein
MVKVETETIKGTSVAIPELPPPVVIYGRRNRRMEFSAGTDHADLAGTCETKQDLRDLLRQLLAELGAE